MKGLLIASGAALIAALAKKGSDKPKKTPPDTEWVDPGIIPETPPATSSESSKPTNEPFSCKYNALKFPLRYGSCGGNVGTLQKWLKYERGFDIDVDNAFGKQTEAALNRATKSFVMSESVFNRIK